MIKIIISALLIVLSVFIYAKFSKPLMSVYHLTKSENIALARKTLNYKKQISILKNIKRIKIILKKQKASTYMFTLLSFVNYLKSKGFSVKLKLNKLTQTKPVTHTIPNPQIINKRVQVKPVSLGGFSPYETRTKFAGVKKINVILSFKGYYGLVPILSVMEKLYVLFPIKFVNFTMSKKSSVINFNLYSFKGV